MPTTTTYKLGRDSIADIPGVENDDIIDATINVSAADLDVTAFKITPLTELVHMAGLVEITIDVNATNVDGAVGLQDTFDIAGLPNTGFELVILDVKDKVTPKGKVEYTVTYGFAEAEA